MRLGLLDEEEQNILEEIKYLDFWIEEFNRRNNNVLFYGQQDFYKRKIKLLERLKKANMKALKSVWERKVALFKIEDEEELPKLDSESEDW